MILFFILIFFFFALITLKFKIEVENFYFNSQVKKKISKDYEIKIIFKIFGIIPILKLKINNKKIKEFAEKPTIKNKIEEEKTKIFQNNIQVKINPIKVLRNLKIDVKKLKLKINIGTEDAALTAYIISTISTVLAFVLNRRIKKINEEQRFKVNPIYINQNLLNIEFSGIFEIKMKHIINTIMFVKKSNKKRKGDKNERTSNRRSYEYSYGQY